MQRTKHGAHVPTAKQKNQAATGQKDIAPIDPATKQLIQTLPLTVMEITWTIFLSAAVGQGTTSLLFLHLPGGKIFHRNG